MAENDSPPTLASLRRSRSPRPRPAAPSAPPGPGLFDLFAPPEPLAPLPATEATAPASPSSEPQPGHPDPSPEGPPLRAAKTGTLSETATLSEPQNLRISPGPALESRSSQPARSPEAPHPAHPPATEPEPEPETQSQTWTVTSLIRHVRGLVERGYGRVTVEGEISNWRPAASGHCYFTLKDAGAQISAVLFRRQASLLRFRPTDGDAVKINGQLSVYESRGQMQLIVEWMQQAGLGALLAAVQQLKERLRREGLFDNKRPLPPFPRCIGVITSLQGAALRDIVKVCRRRHASVRLLIYPAAVQGPNCPAEVTAGLRWFNAHPDRAEVILVARGGGSWEDLHGFDHEDVARAIAASALPVITGIGHATDSTIADAAADVCAPTPSAAAELLTAAQHRIEDHVARLQTRLTRAGSFELLRARQRLAHLGAATVLRRVEDALNRRAQRLDELNFRAHAGLRGLQRRHDLRLKAAETRLQRQDPTLRVQNDRRRLEALQNRLERASTLRLTLGQRRADAAHARLETLSPLRVLDRGYALVYGPDGHLLRSAAEAKPGDDITTRLANGSLKAKILSQEP